MIHSTVKAGDEARQALTECARAVRSVSGNLGDREGHNVMLRLLEEELSAYKEMPGDTAQERYNTLCDLLDICHEESSHIHLRAVYLCEMAKVVCFQDFSEQTDCSAVDFIHEALRLLDEEPETPENADKLKDDKAHALLWLYICTLEKTLQEVSAVSSIICLFLWIAVVCLHKGVRRSKTESVKSSLFLVTALKALQILTDFSRQLADNEACASSLIHSASILLDLGSTELAQTQLDQVESVLPSNTAEGSSSLSLLAILVKAQCHYNNGQIDCGLRCLIEVLKELKKQQKQSKSWYLLRARTLQTSASFLSIDAHLQLFLEPDGLVSGDNLALKWQLLAELLNCSKKMVSVRSDCGAINDARLQCLEALKLAIKLQTLSQCSELLVIKAELELMQGEKDESRTDLDIVRNLLERSTDFSDQVQRAEVKIKPRKGRPVQRPQSPLPTIEDDLKDILSTRWTSKEPIVKDLSGSPPLKALPHRWLSSLTHEPECQCPCCSEPCLGRATARWAAAQADLLLQLDPNDTSVSSKLQWATLSRSKTVTAKLGVKLAKLFPLYDTGKIISKPSLMQDIVGRVYLHMALSGVDPSLTKVCAIWKILEAGLAFVESTPSPMLRPVRAGLMTAKAIASLISLAAKNECTPEELFSKAWTWNMPKEGKDLKSEQKTDPPASVLKKSKDVIKNSVTADPKKEAKKTRSVEFSDESDSEANAQAEPKVKAEASKTRTTARRAGHNTKTTPDAPAEKVPPKRQVRGKKSTVVPRAASSEDETLVCRPGSTRRTRKQASADAVEEPDTMRTIEEETPEILDMSIEQLRTSDAEDNSAASKDNSMYFVHILELKKKSTCQSFTCIAVLFLNYISEFRLQRSFSLTLLSAKCDVQSLLHSAWLTLQHFPPPTLYPTLCALLALTTGQQNSITTAMLHSHSVGITSRHRTIRKLKKASSELEDKMHTLSLNELTQTVCEQRLTQMENIFSFPTADPSTFPETHVSLSILSVLGVTACVMSVMGVKPGEMGNSIMLTRLEKSSAPVTVYIDTSKQKVKLVQEMDSILVEQKVVSCVSEKAKWWEGRRTLDSRVEVLLSASPVLSEDDLKRFTLGVSPQWDTECDQLLHTAVSQLLQRDEPRNHVVLILDKYLQKLPWESIPVLKSSSVSRMPSLHSLLGLSIQKESILRRGVDAKKVFYVLDPDDNLGNSQERFKDWFCSKPDWEGVCGAAPALGRLEEAVATKDVYIYVGHGAGARFLDSQAVLKRPLRAASLLFGCSSGALAVRGQQEGNGIVLNYIIAGCPFILGNLWDVTDRDIDRFTKALLESWFSAGSGAPLLDFMGSSRQATHLKYLIGSAPVVYGLPVHLS
uniref:separase n=1 Tax=Neolamprologus brichardi TaxID=32507 RepID=A0A3Q4HSX9_NEOBR